MIVVLIIVVIQFIPLTFQTLKLKIYEIIFLSLCLDVKCFLLLRNNINYECLKTK